MTAVFASKLDRIHETLSLCFQTSHVALSHMIAQCAKRPVYCVGSGGSVVVAEFLAQCRAQLGFAMSSSVTPMAFALERSDPAASNWFFSASGENQDIQAAFEHGLRGAPEDLYVLTNARGGTLARLALEHGGDLLRIASRGRKRRVSGHTLGSFLDIVAGPRKRSLGWEGRSGDAARAVAQLHRAASGGGRTGEACRSAWRCLALRHDRLAL